MLCVTVRVIMDLERHYTIGETFPLFLRNRSVWVCVFFLHPLPRVQCGGKDKGDKANGLSALLNMM